MAGNNDRRKIEEELLGWMSSHPEALAQEEDPFDRLARGLFEVQFEACAPYSRFCNSLDRPPSQVASWQSIPAVPTGAFKEFELRSFDPSNTIKTFRTSGTSSSASASSTSSPSDATASTERLGALHLDTLELYEASLLASLRRCFVTDLVGQKPAMRFLAPSPAESPDSSLTHMFECLRIAEGSDDSGYDLVQGELDLDRLSAAIADARQQSSPLIVAGTSFAFVHLLDATGSKDWQLPEGSRLMETGGFKGRSRSVPREKLRAEIAACFGLSESRVVNQYGMTELASQFYDSTIVDPTGPRRKLSPPWTRVRIVDPTTETDVAEGEVGMIVIHDLANTGSVAAIQTADLGRAVLDDGGNAIGFDVLGREEGAEARGCSIATDLMLDASRRERTS